LVAAVEVVEVVLILEEQREELEVLAATLLSALAC
jgi:hypothetical protein